MDITVDDLSVDDGKLRMVWPGDQAEGIPDQTFDCYQHSCNVTFDNKKVVLDLVLVKDKQETTATFLGKDEHEVVPIWRVTFMGQPS